MPTSTHYTYLALLQARSSLLQAPEQPRFAATRSLDSGAPRSPAPSVLASNARRRHSALGQLSRADYEAVLAETALETSLS